MSQVSGMRCDVTNWAGVDVSLRKASLYRTKEV
jgi:Fe2+ transport system protein B